MSKSVSIVICTYNRAAFLNRTLYSLKKLNYKNFEVVVVNGPSTDNTEDILYRYKGAIKTGNCDVANLSVSRNIGIRLSAGEIIAFIDDDAIPDKYWLDDIVSLYSDSFIGGVGGKVYDPIWIPYAFTRGYVDIWGDADVHNKGPDYNDPDGFKFNLMLGTNCTFSREALLAVNGFDEYYDYFHDESDLCLRVVKAGYKILNHPQAYIFHEFAKGHNREDNMGYKSNWYSIIKNKVYFALKNSQGYVSNQEQDNKAFNILSNHISWFFDLNKEGKISNADFSNFTKNAVEGYIKGCIDGRKEARFFGTELEGDTPFKKYEAPNEKPVHSICLLSRYNIFDGVGGTAKHTYELAKGFAKAGHIVHVITSGEVESSWIEEGIGIHTVSIESKQDIDEMVIYPTSYGNIKYSYAVYRKINEIHSKYGLDIIESALWDYEGVVAASALKKILPIIVRLQTPLLKVVETQNWELTDDLKQFSGFEAQLMMDSTAVINISDNIKDTIEELYPVKLSEDNTHKVYLGVDENKKVNNRKSSKNVRILFVGRLERRKGIHTIFDVIPKLMNDYANLEFHILGNTDIHDEILMHTFKDYFNKTYGKESWSDRVCFLGQADNDTKDLEFANCDIFIAPSLYESFGIILIEAMSARKPVIGCDIGGMREIIADGETGFTIKVEDSNELYQKLKYLIDNADIRKKFGENSYKRFKEMFSNEIMINKSIEVYEKYIND